MVANPGGVELDQYPTFKINPDPDPAVKKKLRSGSNPRRSARIRIKPLKQKKTGSVRQETPDPESTLGKTPGSDRIRNPGFRVFFL